MAGLNDFIQRLQRLSAGEVYKAMGSKMADACHAQAIAGFREQRNPYGERWAPRKSGGAWPVLQKTGAGVDSLTARYMGGAVIMRIKGYFRFHQHSTSRMVARMVFPTQDRGLGMWREPLQQAAADGVRELIRGRST